MPRGTMSLSRLLVIGATLMFAGFGLYGLFWPGRLMATIHVQGLDATAFNEIRAMYGGFELAIAAFLVACLAGRWPLRAGLFLTTAILVAAPAARTKSMFVDGMPDWSFVAIWLFELAYAAACVAALRRDEE